jgi:hypothetical protein
MDPNKTDSMDPLHCVPDAAALTTTTTAPASGDGNDPDAIEGNCVRCHATDKPMGVNCYTSQASSATTIAQAVQFEGKGGPPGTVCAGTEYTQAYTCEQAYGGYFKSKPAIGGDCNHYKKICCEGSGALPPNSDPNAGSSMGQNGSSYGSHPTMESSNGNSGGSYGSGDQVRPMNEALVSSLKQLLSSVAVDAPTQAKVQQNIAALEAALAGCGGAVAPSGPMQELTCGGAAGATQVKFVPFDKAGPNLLAEVAAAKASGSRVCFCR